MAILKRAKSTIYGLTGDLATINQAITDEASARATADGDLTALLTTDKTSLVAAVNEAFGVIDTVSSETVKIANNLSDVDAATARTNLELYSTTEVDDAITTAQLSIGSNFNVATIAERDALTDLDLADRVFVVDDGDSKWAMYKPSAIDDGTGDVTSWVKLSDQDSLENSINSASIKAAYESNADTNAYTDADKAKVDLVTVTEARDLDNAVYRDALEQDLAVAAPTDSAPSAASVKAYADEVSRQGGSTPILESVTVVGDDITLTHTPKGGVNGIMNFATCRYVDGNGNAFDAPLIATVDDKVFTISVDTADQWDTFSVQVQYLYTAA